MQPSAARRALALTALLLAACAPVEKKAPAPAAANEKPATMSDDAYLWLEDIHGEKPLAWVRAENERTAKAYAETPQFETMRSRILEVLDSDAKIPFVAKIGERYYNFWKDKAHPRGLWRRTTLAEYRKDQPAWETVIDVDALGKAEGKSWVWHGAQCLKPQYRRCLVSLSPGGGDADVVREFDLVDKKFVAGGFELPEAKTQVAWIDADRIYVATDFGPGSMTKSSYPRIVKEWRRGTPLSSATLVYEGTDDDLAISAYRDLTPGYERDFVVRTIDFFTSETFLRGKDGKLTKIDVPLDAVVGTEREWLLIQPRTAWTVNGKTYPSGSLLATRFDDYVGGKREIAALFTPSETTSLSNYSWTRRHLILDVLDDVVSKLEVLTPPKGSSGEWQRAPLGGAPALSTIEAGAVDADADDAYFLTVSGFLDPTTLYYGSLGDGEATPIKRAPAFFDASKNDVQQHFATSKDGTRVPYFVIAPKGMKSDGSNPTLLYGYGGFEVSLQPAYSGSVGRSWLERGGVYVIANIRGGGEYGPRWHQAALKSNRLRAYEDFAAVAEDLVKRGITSRAHLGAEGGSNGGLLVGNMLTLYPQLFGAIVCEVPLLDMQRYTKLSAGASWIAEYGDPDKPEEWAYIQKFSPYRNVEKGVDYPPVLFYTATSDDRVGPVQARKMAAKMTEQLGYRNVWFYENTEGGHGAAADNRQSAFMHALAYSFLWNHLAQAPQ
ncbi:prolyl oligopeptidase family serine peptidase [Dokdonella sp.]|uniref:prolyl oligopeptidase family serine peptidase n=1 Tax=Dokdonella sp. TaxID=2291710 RepID=UPI001B056F73|nr:prolyl oligopeptidase family serine peptidase [Dokdonella sp.]MBO9662178.1 S9 family peptidase [Dokdonella sp.]